MRSKGDRELIRLPGSARRMGRALLLALLLGAQAPMVAAGTDEPPDYDLAAQGDPERGASLYQRYCRGCHGADGRGGGHTFMPHVDTLTRAGHIEYLPDQYLYVIIDEGGVAVGKSSYMPAWGPTLSEQDIFDVIAFIRSLPTY